MWDNAAWRVSRSVRCWVAAHNRRVHREGGVHIAPCLLPSACPWRNPIAPKWGHAKRRGVEPARLITTREREERVPAAFACPLVDHLAMLHEVA